MWGLLALVLLDEVAAAVAAGVWGSHVRGALGATLAVLAVVAVWWAFASPRAPLGHRVGRPVVKVLVFGLASAGLWAAGHAGWALALLLFSVVVNGLAERPRVRALAGAATRPAG